MVSNEVDKIASKGIDPGLKIVFHSMKWHRPKEILFTSDKPSATIRSRSFRASTKRYNEIERVLNLIPGSVLDLSHTVLTPSMCRMIDFKFGLEFRFSVF